MKRDRRIDGFIGRQKIVHSWFPAVALCCVLACLYGALYAAGIARGLPSAVLPAGETIVEEAYNEWAVLLGVVKIVCGDFRGSGVVIAQDEDGLVIVSAKHLLMYDVRAAVSFAGAESEERAESGGSTENSGRMAGLEGSVIGYSASYDLAYLYVPWSAFPADAADDMKNAAVTGNTSDMSGAAISAEDGQRMLICTDDGYRELRAGDPITQVGLSGNAEPEYYTGTAQAKEIFISDYNASMLLNECYAAAGMSGGGAFDESGRLVGIIIAGDEQGTVCMPITTVLAEYQELVGEKNEYEYDASSDDNR